MLLPEEIKLRATGHTTQRTFFFFIFVFFLFLCVTRWPSCVVFSYVTSLHLAQTASDLWEPSVPKTRLLKNHVQRKRKNPNSGYRKNFVAARVKVRFRDEIAVLLEVPFLRRLCRCFNKGILRDNACVECPCGMVSVARTSVRIYPTSRGLSPARRCASPNLTRSGVGETTWASLPETRC